MVQKRYFPLYLLLWIVAILLVFGKVNSSSGGYIFEYIFLWIGYIYAISVFIVCTSRYNIDILEPIIIMTFVYIMMFLVSPMLSILNGTTMVLGVDVYSACIPGTAISLVAFSAYYYGYYKSNYTVYDYRDEEEITINPNSSLTFICFCGWLVCFAVTLAVVMASGKSLSYILSLGNSGEIVDSPYTSTPLGFLSLLEFSMIGFWLYICTYSRNMVLKIGILILSVVAYMSMGSRHVVIEMAVAYAVLHYTTKRKRPNILVLLAGIFGILLFSVALGAMRSGFQQGMKYNLDGIASFENIYYVIFTSNFDIYKVYYGIIQAIPSKMDFTMGEYIWDSIVKLIPRILWPGKPAAVDTAYARVVMGAISEFATKGAYMAMPNLGAYYMEFGLVGCVLYPFFGGRFFGKVKQMYQESTNIDMLIAASILCGMQFQILIRGSNLAAMLTSAVVNLLPVMVVVCWRRVFSK